MELRADIKKTIEYAKSYDATLDADQIRKRLISKNIYTKEAISKLVSEMGIELKNKRGDIYEKKMKKAKTALKVLETNQDILFMGVTGSVSYENPKESDDIDLMVITKKNKLWTTRLWLKLWLRKNKVPHRKYNRKEKPDEFCFNLWLDESALLIPKSKQNFKNALDLLNTKVIFNKNNIWEKFIRTNSWAGNNLATPYFYLTTGLKSKNRPVKNIDKKPSILDKTAYYLQLLIIKQKRKKDLVDFNKAFFHDFVVKK